jgi:hypothetical protein
MTPQEVFDKVATHLLTQRSRAVDRLGGDCVYRAPDGTKCAIGCLIPDELYCRSLEGLSAQRIGIRLAEDLPWIAPVTESGLLMALQTVHDGRAVGAWPEYLNRVASDYQLSNAVVERFLNEGWSA